MLVSLKPLRALLDSLLHSSAGKALIASLCFWILSFFYCKYTYWPDPHSAFFSSDHVYDLNYSAFREAQGNAFIANASQPDKTFTKASSQPEICAAFVTVHRERKNYMAPAIGSMLEGLTDEERKALYVAVLFGDTTPEVHESYNAPWLNATDLAKTYEVSPEQLSKLQEMERSHKYYEKGVFDYLWALNTCHATTAPYIAIFEDDIILADGWLAKTRHAIRSISHHAGLGQKFHNWLYLRLFYTETSLQWGPEDFWYAHLPLTFLLAALLTCPLLITLRLFVPRTRRSLDNYAIGVLSCITAPAFIALAFMIGKFSLLNPQGVFVLNKYGCCTQAMVFPREQVVELMRHLEEVGSGQTDTLLEDYADARGKQRLALGPQVVQHVGLISSRDNTVLNAQSTWAFWFEMNDPARLKREHEALVKSGFDVLV